MQSNFREDLLCIQNLYSKFKSCLIWNRYSVGDIPSWAKHKNINSANANRLAYSKICYIRRIVKWNFCLLFATSPFQLII